MKKVVNCENERSIYSSKKQSVFDRNFVTASVRVPNDYPVTPLANYCIKKHKGSFAMLSIGKNTAAKFGDKFGHNYYTYPWNARI